MPKMDDKAKDEMVKKQLERKLNRLLKLVYSLNHRKRRVHYEDDIFKANFPNKYYIYKIQKNVFYANSKKEVT